MHGAKEGDREGLEKERGRENEMESERKIERDPHNLEREINECARKIEAKIPESYSFTVSESQKFFCVM